MPPDLLFFRPRRGTEPDVQGLGERLWLRRQLARVAKDIRKHGWTLVPVQLPHDKAPRWFYTVGFDETFGHPELIIFDVPRDVAAAEFQHAFEVLRRGAKSFEDGAVWLEEGPARYVVRTVHPARLASEGWLGLAQERRRLAKGTIEGFGAFQIVLPDRSGVLPWEAGHDETARKWQPDLYLPPKREGEAVDRP